MKYVILDIDGVLNSYAYDMVRTKEQSNIDETRLPLLKKIIEGTDAKIILSSTWRCHWDRSPELCDDIGKELNEIFFMHDIEIFDKVEDMPKDYRRSDEIREWVSRLNKEDKFVIIDDAFGGWGELDPLVVKTNYRIGRGLEARHVEKAIDILNRE